MTDLNDLFLSKGAHTCDDGACLMEARALLLGLRKTDQRQPGVSPVLHAMGISLNDSFPDDRRQELKRFLPHDGVDPLAGTDDGRDEQRSYMALDWLIRTFTPAFLDLRPELADAAAELRGLPRIVDMASAYAAGPAVRKSQEKASAAGAAAGAAARAAVEAAAEAAVGAAAWAAAWAAARAAVEAAARAAVEAALRPTVDQLQTSAIQLYGAMIDPPAVTA